MKMVGKVLWKIFDDICKSVYSVVIILAVLAIACAPGFLIAKYIFNGGAPDIAAASFISGLVMFGVIAYMIHVIEYCDDQIKNELYREMLDKKYQIDRQNNP